MPVGPGGLCGARSNVSRHCPFCLRLRLAAAASSLRISFFCFVLAGDDVVDRLRDQFVEAGLQRRDDAGLTERLGLDRVEVAHRLEAVIRLAIVAGGRPFRCAFALDESGLLRVIDTRCHSPSGFRSDGLASGSEMPLCPAPLRPRRRTR